MHHPPLCKSAAARRAFIQETQYASDAAPFAPLTPPSACTHARTRTHRAASNLPFKACYSTPPT
eukprot:1145459-Pelagomonas_calceolata.AAC.1